MKPRHSFRRILPAAVFPPTCLRKGFDRPAGRATGFLGLAVVALAMGTFTSFVTTANAATILNSTTFDGTEPTSDGNATGAENPGGAAAYDTINGWTWGTDWFSPGGGGASTGNYTGSLFAGLATIDTNPNRPIEDQLIRVGANLELLPTGEFGFNWGLLTGPYASHTALAQAFSLSGLGDVTVTYDANMSAFGAYIYVDNGSGSWTTRAHSVLAGVNSFTFTPTGTDIRIAFVNRDGDVGTTDFLKLDSIEVSQDTTGSGPQITSFTGIGGGIWEVKLLGNPNTGYEFQSSPILDFNPGTLVENLTDGVPAVGTIGGINDSVLTTDSNGDGTVRMTLAGPRNFVRAQGQ